VIPVSAVERFQVGTLADLLVARLPPGRRCIPAARLTDEPEATLVAELIREAALEGVRDELPHSIAVTSRRCCRTRAATISLTCMRFSMSSGPAKKGIILGHKGERLRTVGTEARRHIEALLGSKVYLDLHVKIAKDWQRDPKTAAPLGF